MVALAFAAAGPVLAEVSFLKISTPTAVGYPYGVSADGTYVVGQGGYTGLPSGSAEAFRWTIAGGYEFLGDLPGGNISSVGRAVSADGSVVVGQGSYGSDALDREATRWTASTGTVGLGFLPGHDFSGAGGVTGNGAVIVGTSRNTLDGSTQRAFRWTESGGMQDLGNFVPGGRSLANSINPDGSIVYGSVDVDTNYHQNAAFWTEGGGWQSLGVLPGGLAQNNSQAYGASVDGSVIAGMSSSTMSQIGEAFRWTESGGMQALGFLGHNNGTYISSAGGITADGSIIVGTSSGLSVQPTYEMAFIWDQAHGMRSLKDVLINDYGVTNIQPDFYLTSATGISADGSTIVGLGYRNGNTVPWVATGIPEPSALVLLLGGIVTALRRRF